MTRTIGDAAWADGRAESTRTREPSPGGTGGGLGGAIAAEWTKLWSVRSTWWSLLAGVVLMAATSLQLALYVANSNTNTDPTDDRGVVAVGQTAIGALELAEFAIVALAMLMITSEYSAGTMRATLQWVPRRGRMLLAKVAVVVPVTFVLGTALGILGALVAKPVQGRWGSVPLPGTAGDALAIGGYLALIAVFTLGLGAALRSAVATLITVFMIIEVVPTLFNVSHIAAVKRLADLMPAEAGQHFMLGDHSPYPAGVGLLLLAGWAVAALIAGYAVLRRRDA
ncbi:ABC transporter permease subunit [Rugosimonospora acidiphila]|uniref:ABC transporter permease subunit n=1 Tax=Rugosimonospora acidiphila TaxID=556531 RepID=A0ABP9RR59_9ACTN